MACSLYGLSDLSRGCLGIAPNARIYADFTRINAENSAKICVWSALICACWGFTDTATVTISITRERGKFRIYPKRNCAHYVITPITASLWWGILSIAREIGLYLLRLKSESDVKSLRISAKGGSFLLIIRIDRRLLPYRYCDMPGFSSI